MRIVLGLFRPLSPDAFWRSRSLGRLPGLLSSPQCEASREMSEEQMTFKIRFCLLLCVLPVSAAELLRVVEALSYSVSQQRETYSGRDFVAKHFVAKTTHSLSDASLKAESDEEIWPIVGQREEVSAQAC